MTGQLARYMVSARDRSLPPAVLVSCKHRILDTFGAMISGARMRPGQMASNYVRALGGVDEASVVGSSIRTTAINAALANAMCAHADEADDFEPVTKAHPGSSTVPAALAMAEKEGRSGEEFVRAVALGYDLCCRLLVALGPDLVRGTHRSAEGTSSTFGALGAAASLARLDEQGMRFAISYAAQQVSGLWSWVKDEDHIEKAFDFAGMGARNGVTAIQSPLDALLTLRKNAGLTPENVRHILVKVPSDAVGIVGGSAMPDVNCQHLVALALVKGAVSFTDSHDAALLHDPTITTQRAKVELAGEQALMDPEAPRGAIVEVTLNDGRKVRHHTRFPPGTKEKSAQHRAGEREGPRPNRTSPRGGQGSGPHRSDQHAGDAGRCPQATAVDHSVIRETCVHRRDDRHPSQMSFNRASEVQEGPQRPQREDWRRGDDYGRVAVLTRHRGTSMRTGRTMQKGRRSATPVLPSFGCRVGLRPNLCPA